jgi:hypothetical protein
MYETFQQFRHFLDSASGPVTIYSIFVTRDAEEAEKESPSSGSCGTLPQRKPLWKER